MSTPQAENTKLELMYRDGDNYKTFLDYILTGPITEAQIAELKSLLTDGCDVIANEVGLPTPAEGMFVDYEPSEQDHPYTTLVALDCAKPNLSDFLTCDPADTDLTVDELIIEVRAAKWNEMAEIERLGIPF